MNGFEDLIRAIGQKLTPFSARALVNVLTLPSVMTLLFYSTYAQAQPTQNAPMYLEHSILVSRHTAPNNTYSQTEPNHRLVEIVSASGLQTYSLEDADPYYFAFDSARCHIDPFESNEDGHKNRQLLATCLRSQLWENDHIPFWVRATGATVLIGAAGSSGKMDDSIKLNIDFDQVDNLLRNWLDKPSPLRDSN